MMVTTRSQGALDGQSPHEEETQPEVPQPTHKEIQLEERNYVSEVLNLSDEAIGTLNLQILQVFRGSSLPRGIFMMA